MEEPKKVEAVVTAPAPTPEPAAATPAKKTPWLLIALGVLLAAGIGGGLAFLVAKRMKKDDEDDGEKKKKKGKKKTKTKADVEVDEDD